MTAIDDYANNDSGLMGPLERGFAITPDDDVELSNITRQLYIGTGGALAVVMKNGDEVTFANVPTGFLLDCRVRKVLETGTDAEDIVGLY